MGALRFNRAITSTPPRSTISEKSLGKLRDEIPTGLWPSAPDDKVPLWIDGENITFEEGAVQPRLPYLTLVAGLDFLPARGLLEVYQGGQKVAFWGSGTKLYRHVDGSSTVTAVGTGYTGDLWSLTDWGEQVIATNGVDPPQIYGDSSAPTAFIPLHTVAGATGISSATRWKIVRQNGPFILAFGLEGNPRAFRWCSEDAVNIWAPVAGNSAGDLTARDLLSEIICAVDLNEGIGFYGLNQLHIARYVGGQFVFAQDHLLTDVGAFGKYSVAPVGRYNYGFGPKGFFRTDGAAADYLDQPAIHDYVFQRLNRSKAHKSVAWSSARTSFVYWSFPEIGSDENSRTVGFSWKHNAWTIFPFGFSAASYLGVFDAPIFLSTFGSLLIEGTEGTETEAGAPIHVLLSADIIHRYDELGYDELGYNGTFHIG